MTTLNTVISIRYSGGAMELRSFLCCQTLLDVYIAPQLHWQNVKGTSVPSMRVTLYLHSATTCIQKLFRHLQLFWKATKIT